MRNEVGMMADIESKLLEATAARRSLELEHELLKSYLEGDPDSSRPHDQSLSHFRTRSADATDGSDPRALAHVSIAAISSSGSSRDDSFLFGVLFLFGVFIVFGVFFFETPFCFAGCSAL